MMLIVSMGVVCLGSVTQAIAAAPLNAAQALQRLPAGFIPDPVPLVQTIKPITRAYPGVDASIMGIRAGMTVSQVEAIAAKRGLGPTADVHMTQLYVRLPEFVTHLGKPFAVNSKEYVDHVDYMNGALDIYFSSPVTGNRSEAVSLETAYPSDPKSDPFTTSALAVKMVRKFGPSSFHPHDLEITRGDWYFWWDYDEKSLLKTCGEETACFPYPGEFYFPSILAYDTQRTNEIQPSFYIFAWIHANTLDRAKTYKLDLSLGDVRLATLDHDEAMKQLKMAGIYDAENAQKLMEAKATKARQEQEDQKQEKRKQKLNLVPKF